MRDERVIASALAIPRRRVRQLGGLSAHGPQVERLAPTVERPADVGGQSGTPPRGTPPASAHVGWDTEQSTGCPDTSNPLTAYESDKHLPLDASLAGWGQEVAGPFVDVSGGRYINVVSQGANPTGEYSSSGAFAVAIKKAMTMAAGAVYVPRGVYLLDKPIVIAASSATSPDEPWSTGAAVSPLTILGDFAILQAVGPLSALIQVGAGVNLALKRLVLWGGPSAVVGLSAKSVVGPASVIEQVTVRCVAGPGFDVEDCSGLTFRACVAEACGAEGWRISGSQGVVLSSCTARSNQGSGFVVVAQPSPVGVLPSGGGCNLLAPMSAGNAGHGISLLRGASGEDPSAWASRVPGVNVRDGWVLGNGCDGIRVALWGANIAGMRIDPKLDGSALEAGTGARAIRILKGTFFSNIQGCMAVSNGGDYARVQIEDSPALPKSPLELHYVDGNVALDPMEPKISTFLPIHLGTEIVYACPTGYVSGFVSTTDG